MSLFLIFVSVLIKKASIFISFQRFIKTIFFKNYILGLEFKATESLSICVCVCMYVHTYVYMYVFVCIYIRQILYLYTWLQQYQLVSPLLIPVKTFPCTMTSLPAD